jgi:hypothetical protein
MMMVAQTKICYCDQHHDDVFFPFMQHVKSVKHMLLCCPTFCAYPSVCLICFKQQARGVRHRLFVAPPLMVPIALFCSPHLCIFIFGCYLLVGPRSSLVSSIPLCIAVFYLIRFGQVTSRRHFIETLKWNPLLPCGFC